MKEFSQGQVIFVKVHQNSLFNWQRGMITKRLSDDIYIVNVNGVDKKYHIGHIRGCQMKDKSMLYGTHYNGTGVVTPFLLLTLQVLNPQPAFQGTPPVNANPQVNV
jgi:hypothetical protein